jgi:hypothetical protein
LVIWNTNPAISHNPKGGVFIPGLDYLKDSMELHVLKANYVKINFVSVNINIHFNMFWQFNTPSLSNMCRKSTEIVQETEVIIT